jgi:hypothetical protein
MLKYIGDGFIPGVPARDLTDEEVEKCGGEEFLLSTGLYKKSKSKPQSKKEKAEKAGE